MDRYNPTTLQESQVNWGFHVADSKVDITSLVSYRNPGSLPTKGCNRWLTHAPELTPKKGPKWRWKLFLMDLGQRMEDGHSRMFNIQLIRKCLSTDTL